MADQLSEELRGKLKKTLTIKMIRGVEEFFITLIKNPFLQDIGPNLQTLKAEFDVLNSKYSHGDVTEKDMEGCLIWILQEVVDLVTSYTYEVIKKKMFYGNEPPGWILLALKSNCSSDNIPTLKATIRMCRFVLDKITHS